MMAENINLTQDDTDFIRRSVEGGDYQDASAVVRAGLRLLEASQSEKRAREAELRAMLEKALDGGMSDRTPEEIWAAAKARHSAD